MPAFHRLSMRDGVPYLDDFRLEGVTSVEIRHSYDSGYPTATIEFILDDGGVQHWTTMPNGQQVQEPARQPERLEPYTRFFEESV